MKLLGVTFDANGTIERLWPLLEDGLTTGVIDEKEASDLLTEAIIKTIRVEDA
jgi:hypothetical protein